MEQRIIHACGHEQGHYLTGCGSAPKAEPRSGYGKYLESFGKYGNERVAIGADRDPWLHETQKLIQ